MVLHYIGVKYSYANLHKVYTESWDRKWYCLFHPVTSHREPLPFSPFTPVQCFILKGKDLRCVHQWADTPAGGLPSQPGSAASCEMNVSTATANDCVCRWGDRCRLLLLCPSLCLLCCVCAVCPLLWSLPTWVVAGRDWFWCVSVCNVDVGWLCACACACAWRHPVRLFSQLDNNKL